MTDRFDKQAYALLKAFYAKPEPKNLQDDIAAWGREITRQVWQPIETAPKNGTDIDIWVPVDGGFRVADAYWRGDQNRGDWWAPNYDYDGCDGATGYAKTASHWMSLPDPPADTGEIK